MVVKVTIAIDGMVPAQPLGPTVFQWFFSQQGYIQVQQGYIRVLQIFVKIIETNFAF